MFARPFITDVWQGSNMPGLWIYQHSEDVSGPKYTMVLNMPGSHRALNMPEYALIIF